MKLSARTLFLSACLIAGTLVPAFVFAQSSSSIDAQEEQNFNEFLGVVDGQLKYRKQVEATSFETTKKLCEVFNIRKKYGMELRPDPVTETWAKAAHFNYKTLKAYNESLQQWYMIGNEGVLTNWGIKEAPGQEENDWVLKQSQYTRILVSTDGFEKAAKNCGDLDSPTLRKFLFEQERAQTVVTYAVALGVAVRVGMAAFKYISPTLRGTFLGHAMARIPWSGIKKSAAVALVAYVAYSGTMQFWPGLRPEDDSKPMTVEEQMALARDRNIQDALMRWSLNLESKNEAFRSSEIYLRENRENVHAVQKTIEAKLIRAGTTAIEGATAKFTAGEELSNEEGEIFMASVYYSASKLFLSRNR